MIRNVGMMTRREFMIVPVGLSLMGCRGPKDETPVVRFGMVTDLHYARIPDCPGDRYYAQGVEKLRQCVDVMNRRGVDFLVELGDLKDQCETKTETVSCLDEIEAEFRRFEGPRYHVLGNHDNDCLTKAEFLSHVSNHGQVAASGYYSFAVNGVTFVVLDANFNAKLEDYSPGNWTWTDANVPPCELDWLERTLSAAPGRVIVFGHQRIDPAAEKRHRIRNAADVRNVLERSGRVAAVLTGHEHCGGHCVHHGIFYYTLRALVKDSLPESNSFAEVALYRSGRIVVTGYMKAASAAVPR